MGRFPKSKSGKKRFRPERDKIPTNFSLQGTHLADPQAWLQREIQKMAKGAVMRGDYFTLRQLAVRITKAVYPVVCYWNPAQYQIVRRLSREPSGFSFEAVFDQVFLDQIQGLDKLQHFSRDQRVVYLCLCREVLDWVVSHPVTPPGLPPPRPDKSAVMRGDYFAFRQLAEQITEAVYPVVRYWSLSQYEIVRRLSRAPAEFSFEATINQVFLVLESFSPKLEQLSRDQRNIFLYLCRSVLIWIVSHPVTIPRKSSPLRPERGEWQPL